MISSRRRIPGFFIRLCRKGSDIFPTPERGRHNRQLTLTNEPEIRVDFFGHLRLKAGR